MHLPKELAHDLWLWKQEDPNSSPEAFIFPDAKGEFMDTRNYPAALKEFGSKEWLRLPQILFDWVKPDRAAPAP